MQVILKQREIEAALRAYIASEGINLNGKSIEIAFTAGRKEAGIIAEIDIEDVSPMPLPDLALSTVTAQAVIASVSARTVEEVLVEPEAEPAPAETPPEEAAPAPKAAAVSLFG